MLRLRDDFKSDDESSFLKGYRHRICVWVLCIVFSNKNVFNYDILFIDKIEGFAAS